MADGEVEQLWFTWTTRGLGSGRGAQVRAASERLADRRDRASAVARRYCYRPPQERAFGWIDRDSLRVIFNRVEAGLDGVGREGNYFVHVLVGEPIDLPAEHLWSLFDTPFWTTSDPGGDDTWLPTVSIADIGLSRDGRTSSEAQLPFLAHVLHCIERRSGVRMAGDDAAVASLASSVAAAFPPKFGLLSFSTGESLRSAREYDIVCGGAELPSTIEYEGEEAALDLPTVDAAAALLDSSTASQTLVEAASVMSANRREFVRNLETASSFRRGKSTNPQAAVRLATHSPETLEALVDGPGAATYADQVAEGDKAPIAVLPLLGEGSQRRIGERTASNFAEEPGRSIPLLRSVSVEAPLFVRVVVRSIVENAAKSSTISALSGADRIAFVRLLAGCGARMSKTVELLLGDTPEVCTAVATDAGLAVSWRAAAAIRTPESLSDGTFDEVVAGDQQFAAEVLAAIEVDDLAADVRRIAAGMPGSGALSWLDAVGPSLSTEVAEAAWWDSVVRTTHQEMLRQLLDQSARRSSLPSTLWEPRLVEGVTGGIRDRAASASPGDRLLPEERALARCLARLQPQSEQVNAWRRLIDAASRLDGWGDFGREVNRLAGAVQALHGEQREASALLAVERTFDAATRYEDLARLLDWLVAEVPLKKPHGWSLEVLRAASRGSHGRVLGRSPGYAVRWVLAGWESGMTHVPDAGSDEEALLAIVARQVPTRDREYLLEVVDGWRRKKRRRARALLGGRDYW